MGEEIEWGARDRWLGAGRDLSGVGWRVLLGVDPDDLIGGAAGALTSEVEVAVVGEVQHRVQVLGLGGSRVVDSELVGVVQPVGDDDPQLARAAGAALRAAGASGGVLLVAARHG